MLTQRKHKPTKANSGVVTVSDIERIKEMLYKDTLWMLRYDDLNPEICHAMAIKTWRNIKVMNAVLYGREHCPITHKIWDNVITEMAKRWASVDPQAQWVLDAMEG
jgi:hypothetical protein